MICKRSFPETPCRRGIVANILCKKLRICLELAQCLHFDTKYECSSELRIDLGCQWNNFFFATFLSLQTDDKGTRNSSRIYQHSQNIVKPAKKVPLFQHFFSSSRRKVLSERECQISNSNSLLCCPSSGPF